VLPKAVARTGLSRPSGYRTPVKTRILAGGIHSAWEHGWAVGRAIAARVRDDSEMPYRAAHGVPNPEQAAIAAAPRFRAKRALRWAYDRLQFDWPFDLLLHSPPLRWAAGQVYFHKRRR
jgi:hypothetical protein